VRVYFLEKALNLQIRGYLRGTNATYGGSLFYDIRIFIAAGAYLMRTKRGLSANVALLRGALALLF